MCDYQVSNWASSQLTTNIREIRNQIINVLKVKLIEIPEECIEFKARLAKSNGILLQYKKQWRRLRGFQAGPGSQLTIKNSKLIICRVSKATPPNKSEIMSWCLAVVTTWLHSWFLNGFLDRFYKVKRVQSLYSCLTAETVID